MKTFNPLYIFAILLIIGLSSCDDNFETITTSHETSEPTESEGIKLVGRVLDNDDQTIEGATVNILYHDEIITYYTDLNGNYSIELPKDESRVYIQATADDFINSGISAITLDQEETQKDITLLQEDELQYSGSVASLSASVSSSISGQVQNDDGTPGKNVIIILVEFESGGGFNFSSYTETDENGNYVIASEPFTNLAVVALSACEGAEVIVEGIQLNTNEQLDLGIYSSNFTDFPRFTLSGEVTSCVTGEGIPSGEVTISFEGNTKIYRSDIIDGNYTITVDQCQNASCYDISVSSPLYFGESINLDCQPITDAAVTRDFELCDDPITREGEIRILLGADSLIYTTPLAIFDSLSGYWNIADLKDNMQNGIVLLTNATGVGSFNSTYLQIVDNGFLLAFQEKEDSSPVTFQITEINDYLKGTISGQTLTPTGNPINLSGTFNIKIQ